MKKKNKKDKDKEYIVMIGGGDSSIFIHAKKGDKIHVGNGMIQEVGLTVEEERRRIDERLAKSIEKNDRRNRHNKVKQKIKTIFKK